MKRIIGNIYEETDYSVFKALPENRAVLKNRVEKLVASMSQKYLLNPIMVNEKMQVVDGQGRFEACRRLGRPIHYYICKGADSFDCRLLNKYSTNWSKVDFAKSFSDAGNTNYTRLLEAVETAKVPLAVALRLANKSDHTDSNGGIMSPYERGDLIFTASDQMTVIRIARMAREILDALAYTKKPIDRFYVAVKVMCEYEGYDHARMLKNCSKLRHSYVQMADRTSQLKEFERIYNHGAKKGKLYFSDYMRGKEFDSDLLSQKARSAYYGESVSSLK